MLRLKELDTLRGFAALNVVLFHYTTRYRELYHHKYPVEFDWIYGHYGVELFFVISGFVIFMTLHKVKDVREFAIKRFVRLFPTYWICLILTVVFTFLLKSGEMNKITFTQLLINITMIQGVFEVPDIDGAYWSLLPELFFYGFVAFIYAIGCLPKTKIVAVIWLALMVLNQMGLLPFGAYFLNLKYGMFFLSGMLFYELRFNKSDAIIHLLIALCLIIAVWINNLPASLYVFTGIFALFYLFIYDKLRILNFPPLLFLGYVSYPLYLLHQNLGFYLMNILKVYISSEILVIILSILTMIGLAWLVVKIVEKSMQVRLKFGIRNLLNVSFRNAS